MARVCGICGKRTHVGNQIVRSGLAKSKGGVGKRILSRERRDFKPNIQRVRVMIGKTPTRMKVCTKCMKAGKIRKAK